MNDKHTREADKQLQSLWYYMTTHVDTYCTCRPTRRMPHTQKAASDIVRSHTEKKYSAHDIETTQDANGARPRLFAPIRGDSHCPRHGEDDP